MPTYKVYVIISKINKRCSANAPPRLSINVGTSEVELSSFKDIELGQDLEIISNVGKFKSLSVSPTPTINKFVVYPGHYARPPFSRYLMWFGFALFLALLSPLPIYVSVTHPNKEIQNYKSSQCTTIGYFGRKHIGYISVQEAFVATLKYVDENGITRQERFANTIDDIGDVDVNAHMNDFYRRTYYSEEPYLCYYRDNFVVAADKQGWIFMAGLTGGWLVVMAVVAIIFFFKSRYFVSRRTIIPKQTFEGPAHTQMEIVDWGDVPVQMRQSLHAMLFKFLIPDGQDVIAPESKKIVRFTGITINRHPRLALYVSAACALLSFAAVIVSEIAAYTQDSVAYVQLLHSLATIFAVCPSVIACVAVRCAWHFTFTATAELTSKADPTEDIRIASANFTPLRMTGVLLTASLFRTVI